MKFKKPKQFYLHEDDRLIDELNKLLFDFMETHSTYPERLKLNNYPWITLPEPRTGNIIHWNHSTTAGDYQYMNNCTTNTTGDQIINSNGTTTAGDYRDINDTTNSTDLFILMYNKTFIDG